MFKSTGLLMCLCLLGLVLGQTDFKNTCQNESLIPRLATGLINLNPLDTYNNGANKDYYQDLTLAAFTTNDFLGYGFSLTGFETACTNTNNFFSLVVDQVVFENQNTRMRIVVDFRDPGSGAITSWTMVSFTYIVVSRFLNGAYSDIWATVASINNPADNTLLSIDQVKAAYQNDVTTGTTSCEIYQDPDIQHDSTAPGGANCQATAVTAAGDNGGIHIVHAYIMGFRYNAAQSTTSYLHAGVLPGAYGVTRDNMEYTDQIASAPGAVSITYSNVAGTPAGPQVAFYNPNGAIAYIKVAFVHSRFDYQFSFRSGSTTPTYPSGSAMLYSSSYVFTNVSTFNAPVAITRPEDTAAGIALTNNFNRRYYHLPDTRYAIYGLTNFDIPQGSGCTTLKMNATLNSIDSYTIETPNANPSNMFFVADIFTKNVDQLCQPANNALLASQILTLTSSTFKTIPTESAKQFIIEEPQTPATVVVPGITPTVGGAHVYEVFANVDGTNTDTISYEIRVPFNGIRAGAPVKVEFGYFDNFNSLTDPTVNMILGANYTFDVKINDFTVYQQVYTAIAAGTNASPKIMRGINLPSTITTAEVVFTITFARSTASAQAFFVFCRAFEYSNSYDPSTGCCPTECPAQTGLDVQIDPPSCIYCNTAANLVYNATSGSCGCNAGFYLDASKTFACFPCSALYCDSCMPSDPTKCLTCSVGATYDNTTQKCTCGAGYFVNGTTCQACPYQCQTCNSPTGTCATCVDSVNRDINQNCACVTGKFDSGSVNCSSCSSTCLNCTTASTCAACDATKFRVLNGTVCNCMAGYYEFYHTNLTRTCEKCNPECLTCATSPAICTSCDPTKNRLSGVDSSGRQTCLCPAGFYSTADGSCVQSNCNADPFCSECEQGLKLCIKCLASKNRVIKLPESICVCQDGYYPDSNNTCVQCKSGCGICRTATNCTTCVALATPNADGSCSCPAKTYFAVSADGVRYCASCGANCQSCVDSITCLTCQTSYTLTADNRCVCAARHFIDSVSGNCLPCASGCDQCSSATACQSCISPLLLQGSTCQVSCNNGFTAIGSVCQGCPSGCLKCTQNLICYYCADGFHMYKGKCYSVCPAGTIGANEGGNLVCAPCNSPCKTCMNHPSFCTSCLNGKGYLQTSAVSQSCVLSCVAGTYPVGGVCQVCDFKCATCLGSATNCISCPSGQVLYKGGCWSQCPAISLQRVGQNASCSDTCPDGFYTVSQTECAPCAIECTTCSGSARNCTSCLHGSVSTNGSCTVQCGENEFSFRGFCVACSQSCYGCRNSPQDCISCARGYVRTGSICERGCLSHQFFDARQQRCIGCGPGCATCSAFNFCTSCKNPAISPRGGVCSNCPYPCATCDGTGACSSCLSGFFYFQGSCKTSCPYGASPINGVCQCQSGIVSLGQCVTSCGSGFTVIQGSCQPCNPNCAECSGDVNHCTSCISGYTIDTRTKKCASEAQCPYGQEFNQGACTPVCDSGFYFYEGICVYGGCFDGYAPNEFGGCVRSAASTSSGPNCNFNQYNQDGNCVGTCNSKFYPDSATRKCLACAANCVTCFSSNFCVICDTGYQMVDGTCIKATTCSANQYQYEGKCVDRCPIGTSTQGSTCQRSCAIGNYYLGKVCFMSCPTAFRTEEACVNSCPPGTTDNNGVCL